MCFVLWQVYPPNKSIRQSKPASIVTNTRDIMLQRQFIHLNGLKLDHRPV
jgi:hypothetical protein